MEDENEGTRHPIAQLVVNGVSTDIYDVIPEYAHLFTKHAFNALPKPSTRVGGSGSSNRSQRKPGQISSNRLVTAQRKSTAKDSGGSPKSSDKHAIRKVKPSERTRKTARDDEDDEVDDNDVGIKEEETFEMYIGDIEQYKKFLHTRFRELTAKPLRKILTEWIKELEPDRISKYGIYTKEFPEKGTAPPWWPQNILYSEPSHLKMDALISLGIKIMLLHPKMDDKKHGNRKWTEILRERATYRIQYTPVEDFSSSNNFEYNQEMRNRALKELLPSLFNVALSHENHLEKYDLYTGLGNGDLGFGDRVRWQRIRKPALPGTRRQRNKAPEKPRHPEGSDDDIKVDEEMNKVNSCDQSFESSCAWKGHSTEAFQAPCNTGGNAGTSHSFPLHPNASLHPGIMNPNSLTMNWYPFEYHPLFPFTTAAYASPVLNTFDAYGV